MLRIVVAIGSAWLFRKTNLPGKPAPFLMEMAPTGSRPLQTRSYVLRTGDRCTSGKRGGVILFSTLIFWGLASQPNEVEYGSAECFVRLICHLLEPLVAKEVVVGSRGVLYGKVDKGGTLQGALLTDPSLGPVTAFTLMASALLYLPCLTQRAVIRK
ncbi:MAG: ferrous iron transporter B, partial [Methanomicrobiales archaeon]